MYLIFFVKNLHAYYLTKDITKLSSLYLLLKTGVRGLDFYIDKAFRLLNRIQIIVGI